MARRAVPLDPNDLPTLSIAQVAEQLAVNPRTVRRHIASGDLPAFRVGSLIRIRPSDVAALFEPIPAGGAA